MPRGTALEPVRMPSAPGAVWPVNLQAALQPMRAERLECTARQFFYFFLVVNFKVFSNSDPLKGLIMEK